MSTGRSNLVPRILVTAPHDQLVEMLRELSSQRLKAVSTAIGVVYRERFGVFPSVAGQSGHATAHQPADNERPARDALQKLATQLYDLALDKKLPSESNVDLVVSQIAVGVIEAIDHGVDQIIDVLKEHAR